MASELVVHNGGCHCKKVRWRVEAPASVVAWDCNCSNCFMRANTHFIVPLERFKLLGDSSNFVSTYTFGSHTAKHTFCKNCGITSFYRPRSNPDGVAITFKCVDPGTLTHVEVRQFDGSNWEASYDHTGIASFSKLNTSTIPSSPTIAFVHPWAIEKSDSKDCAGAFDLSLRSRAPLNGFLPLDRKHGRAYI
ncbi:uncharacterized protein LOC103502595 isoform X1 [Cucumis melo]|uniref:Uncharacterized protein LOC103502595 isoform X1 n=1 Tax=Cucumis melo TaxID=3656 RepID=A0A1S4E5L6_CUCME|nr:uncharacterized protein LOC103502595 isoform X1 [Cucumis melo]